MNLNQFSIKQAQDGMRKKHFSSSELTRACLEQIEKLEPTLNAFITVCEKEALNQARSCDQKIADGDQSPLLGIPLALKDLFLTKGVKTTAGSKVLENYIPQYTATVVKKLKDAGAVIIGKTNLDAWAHGSSGENSDFGSTKNPWNTEYVPGGSSSGSAVAVSSNMCLAATGTDTGGSIRLPASFCNVVGLKPTYGRVSRYGIVTMASSLDSIGHFAKTVEDAALILEITAGRDSYDATSLEIPVPSYSILLNKLPKELRIGIPKEYFSAGIDPNIEGLIKKSLDILEMSGFIIKEVSLPYTEYAIACYYIAQPAEVSSNLARYDGIRYGNGRSSFGDESKRRIMLGSYTLSAGYYDQYYSKAQKIRTLIVQDFDKAFEEVDAIITPVAPTPPWRLGEKVDDPLKMYLSDIFTVTANLAGIPALSIPIGFVNGLPTGMQILGKQFSECLLFQIGHAYEQQTEWHMRKPNI